MNRSIPTPDQVPTRLFELETTVGQVRAAQQDAAEEVAEIKQEQRAQHGILNTLSAQNDRMLTLLQERYDPRLGQIDKNAAALFDPPAGLAIVAPALKAQLDSFISRVDDSLKSFQQENRDLLAVKEQETTKRRDNAYKFALGVLGLAVTLLGGQLAGCPTVGGADVPRGPDNAQTERHQQGRQEGQSVEVARRVALGPDAGERETLAVRGPLQHPLAALHRPERDAGLPGPPRLPLDGAQHVEQPGPLVGRHPGERRPVLPDDVDEGPARLRPERVAEHVGPPPQRREQPPRPAHVPPLHPVDGQFEREHGGGRVARRDGPPGDRPPEPGPVERVASEGLREEQPRPRRVPALDPEPRGLLPDLT